ncbi:class I SAM-dependent methyltransferase [Streptomyces sp. NPDC048507]|uniref:class I SAM-dependent methyltransferase n=1 Tax=Streptomyces sp. NPDC048507 TaxID=3365560 RepID=UPI003717037C
MADTTSARSSGHRPRVAPLDPLGPAYARAFTTLLAHTTRPGPATDPLAATLAGLSRHRVLIDAGAGTGRLTASVGNRFDQVIAVEPSPHLRPHLARACPGARVLAGTIADADPGEPADLVLCAHVLYHVPVGQWDVTIDRLASWTGPGGSVVLILQNPDGDCMRMLTHFTGHRYDLRSAMAPFTARHPGSAWTPALTTASGAVEAPDLDTALTIAQFLLNDAPLPEPPHTDELADYLDEHHRTSCGGYRLTCPQDYLVLTRTDG